MSIQPLVIARVKGQKCDAMPLPGDFKVMSQSLELEMDRWLNSFSSNVARIVALKYAKSPDSREDAEFSVDIMAWIAGHSKRIETRINSKRFRSVIERHFKGLSTQNESGLRRQTRSVLAVNPLENRPDITLAINDVVSTSIAKIGFISQRYHDEVEALVSDAFVTGRSTQGLAKELERRFNVSKSKARFIARNEMGNANAAFSEIRQTSNGINRYTWSTSQDERVRPNHASKEGQVFNWSDPPPDTGHPGADYNCRCVALPIFDEGVDGDVPEVEAPQEPQPASEDEVIKSILSGNADPDSVAETISARETMAWALQENKYWRAGLGVAPDAGHESFVNIYGELAKRVGLENFETSLRANPLKRPNSFGIVGEGPMKFVTGEPEQNAGNDVWDLWRDYEPESVMRRIREPFERGWSKPMNRIQKALDGKSKDIFDNVFADELKKLVTEPRQAWRVLHLDKSSVDALIPGETFVTKRLVSASKERSKVVNFVPAGKLTGKTKVILKVDGVRVMDVSGLHISAKADQEVYLPKGEYMIKDRRKIDGGWEVDLELVTDGFRKDADLSSLISEEWINQHGVRSYGEAQ